MAISWDMTRFFWNTDFQISVTHNSTSYNAIKYSVKKDNRYTELGLDEDVKFYLLVKDFSPAIGDTITISSVVYRIIEIEEDSRGKYKKLFMATEYGD